MGNNAALSALPFTPTLKMTRSGRLRPDDTLRDALGARGSPRHQFKRNSRTTVAESSSSLWPDYDDENLSGDSHGGRACGTTVRFQNWPGLSGPAVVVFTQLSMVLGELSLSSSQVDKTIGQVRFAESVTCDGAREFVSVAANGIEGVFWNGAVCWLRLGTHSLTDISTCVELSPDQTFFPPTPVLY